MAEQNGKKTVSFVLYVVTVSLLVVGYIVTVTAAIFSRPTTVEVKTMIHEQFDEHSYIGEKMRNIETSIRDMKADIKTLKEKND